MTEVAEIKHFSGKRTENLSPKVSGLQSWLSCISRVTFCKPHKPLRRTGFVFLCSFYPVPMLAVLTLNRE